MSAATNPACPHVYRAINRVTAEFAKAGITKAHVNLIDQYQYRSIDDVMNRLGPLLGRHKLCVLPRVLKRQCVDREGELGELLVNVRLLVAFDLVSARDGSMHTVQAWGEALDAGDKGTAKAMSSAFKYAMLEVFCIPVSSEDADNRSPRLAKPRAMPEPPQGWQAWAEDIMGMIDGCASKEALDGVRTTQMRLLGALRLEQAELYQAIGKRFKQRLAALKGPSSLIPSAKTKPRAAKKQDKRAETVDA